MSSPLLRRTLAPAFALLLLGLLFSAGAQAAGGTAMSWGLNLRGQLGNGTSTAMATDPCACVPLPAPVKGLSGVTQVAAGGEQSLALLANGTVMAWGTNEGGLLGNGGRSGPETCSLAPCSTVPIPVPGLANVVAIAAGGAHNLALLANGTVMAWGKNFRGQLGNGESSGPETCGTEACSTVPIPVPGLTNVVAVAARNLGSLALLANGTVMAWGLDSLGETGDGVGIPDGCFCIDHPVPVPAVSGAMAISAGSNAGYALLHDGTVKAWGANNLGQLGVGTISPEGGCECLGPVSVRGLAGVKAVAAGGNHVLALLSQGSIQAWGQNAQGQLGNGSPTPPATDPCKCIRVAAPVPLGGIAGSAALGVGNNHTLALLPGGGIEAWGINRSGQLGDGTVEDRSTPTAIGAIGGTSGVFAGASTSFALIGPTQALKVSPVGAGSGTVGTQGILCPPSCEGRYPQSQLEILRAEPAAGSGFAGFSGPCTGIAPCQVKLDQDQTVTATFGPPKGTAITRAKVTSRKKSAAFSFAAPGAITGFQCELIKPKPAHKAHKPKGRRRLARAGHKKPKPRFSSCVTPKTYKHLKSGRYAFKVRALDILGPDANPALRRFTIKARKSRRPKPKH